MDCTSGDQKLLSDRRVTNLPSDLEFHLAFQDDDQFVGRMREILPSLSWLVGPEVATEPPFRPIGSNLFRGRFLPLSDGSPPPRPPLVLDGDTAAALQGPAEYMSR